MKVSVASRHWLVILNSAKWIIGINNILVNQQSLKNIWLGCKCLGFGNMDVQISEVIHPLLMRSFNQTYGPVRLSAFGKHLGFNVGNSTRPSSIVTKWMLLSRWKSYCPMEYEWRIHDQNKAKAHHNNIYTKNYLPNIACLKKSIQCSPTLP